MILVDCDRCHIQQNFRSRTALQFEKTWYEICNYLLCNICRELLDEFTECRVFYEGYEQDVENFVNNTEAYWEWVQKRKENYR